MVHGGEKIIKIWRGVDMVDSKIKKKILRHATDIHEHLSVYRFPDSHLMGRII